MTMPPFDWDESNRRERIANVEVVQAERAQRQAARIKEVLLAEMMKKEQEAKVLTEKRLVERAAIDEERKASNLTPLQMSIFGDDPEPQKRSKPKGLHEYRDEPFQSHLPPSYRKKLCIKCGLSQMQANDIKGPCSNRLLADR